MKLRVTGKSVYESSLIQKIAYIYIYIYIYIYVRVCVCVCVSLYILHGAVVCLTSQ